MAYSVHGIFYPHVNPCIEADRTAATEFLRQALKDSLTYPL